MKQHNASGWKLDTLFVQGEKHQGQANMQGTPTVQPIYASTTYLHQNAQGLNRAFEAAAAGDEQAYVYARQGNPNAASLEDVLSQAEGGVGAVTFGSGMAAIHAALITTGLTPGAKILASQDLYGATIGLLRAVFQPMGIEVTLRNLFGPGAAAIIQTEQPDAVFVETLSNPLVKVIDLDAISAAAHSIGALTIVDSTFTTPYLLRPIEHGFDLVVHSATKYMSGHGDSTAGVAISAKKSLLDQLRNYANVLGSMLSPFEAHLVSRGLRTLPLRMERHCQNALQVAHFLQEHEAVAAVHYPGLRHHPQHELATRLLGKDCYGGLLSFELKEQTRTAAYRFMDQLQLILPATTLGDAWSLASYPAMSSHRNLTPADRQSMGITDGCIRLSIGIEHIDDILQDLDQALQR